MREYDAVSNFGTGGGIFDYDRRSYGTMPAVCGRRTSGFGGQIYGTWHFTAVL